MKKMKEFLKERMSKVSENQKGFSLVELIIVIAILGIIAAVAIPNVIGVVDDARKNTDIANAKAIANAVAMVKAKNENLAINELTSEALDGTENSSDLEKNIIAELGGVVTKPKFKSTTYPTFNITVASTGEVTVDVKATAAGSTAIKLYPTPATLDPTWK